jgi:hypothetical protein
MGHATSINVHVCAWCVWMSVFARLEPGEDVVWRCVRVGMLVWRLCMCVYVCAWVCLPAYSAETPLFEGVHVWNHECVGVYMREFTRTEMQCVQCVDNVHYTYAVCSVCWQCDNVYIVDIVNTLDTLHECVGVYMWGFTGIERGDVAVCKWPCVSVSLCHVCMSEYEWVWVSMIVHQIWSVWVRLPACLQGQCVWGCFPAWAGSGEWGVASFEDVHVWVSESGEVG